MSTAHDPEIPLMAHLRELRDRLVYSVAAVGIGFGIAYYFSVELVEIILAPLRRSLIKAEAGAVVFTSVTEPFMVEIKAAAIAGLLMAMPVVGWHVYKFLRPAFRRAEKSYFVWMFVAGGVLFSVGAVFGYFVVLPLGLDFFVSTASGRMLPQLSVEQYFDFAVRTLLAFGLTFEMPLAVLLLARLGLVDKNFFKRQRRVAIVIIFIVGAILTPPDVVSQMLLSLPLLLLYEISAQLAGIMGTREPDEEEA